MIPIPCRPIDLRFFNRCTFFIKPAYAHTYHFF